MKNKKARKMISNAVGNGADWVMNWYDGGSKLIYLFEWNGAVYLHSYVDLGVISLTADQYKAIK